MGHEAGDAAANGVGGTGIIVELEREVNICMVKAILKLGDVQHAHVNFLIPKLDTWFLFYQVDDQSMR